MKEELLKLPMELEELELQLMQAFHQQKCQILWLGDLACKHCVELSGDKQAPFSVTVTVIEDFAVFLVL